MIGFVGSPEVALVPEGTDPRFFWKPDKVVLITPGITRTVWTMWSETYLMGPN